MNKLIMVIDDSTTVRKILATCLGREGFAVVSFPDGIGLSGLWRSTGPTIGGQGAAPPECCRARGRSGMEWPICYRPAGDGGHHRERRREGDRR